MGEWTQGLFLRRRNHRWPLSRRPGEWPGDRIQIAGVVWTASSAVPPLDPDGFGLDSAGAGMHPAGCSVPNPVMAAWLRDVGLRGSREPGLGLRLRRRLRGAPREIARG